MRWQVDGTSDGWIIQHITWISDVHRCNGSRVDAPNEEFWEAWQVRGGVVHVGSLPDLHESDTFTSPRYGDGTRGFSFIRGKVNFLENYKVVVGPPGPWRLNQVPAAGSLPTTRTPPAGWDESAALDHTAEARWNCCGGQTAFVTAVGRAISAEYHNDGRQHPGPIGEGERRMGEGMRKVVRELRAMPAWSNLVPGDAREHEALLRSLEQLQRHRSDTLRAGFAAYADEERRSRGCVEAMSRLFVANRYLFAVPAELPLGSIRFFGGWVGVPYDEESVNPLWPWSVSLSGTLSLIGQFAGYLGDDYLGVQEFDYFRERFGRRC